MSSAIGGYFGLELSQSNSLNPHSGGHAVNSGRNALRCILATLKPRKVLVPVLHCPAVLEPLAALDIPYEYYTIDRFFRPRNISLKPGSYLLYINYFGVQDRIVAELTKAFPAQIIIDNTQAFFSEPIPGIPTFYSARKFFGVPDGAYFYGVDYDLSTLPVDISWGRCTHLLKRIDLSPEEGYQDFLESEELFSNLKPARMSKLTQSMMNSINYDLAKANRSRNYSFFHSLLSKTNSLSVSLPVRCAPISYPYFTDVASAARETLIGCNIYSPVFWSGRKEVSTGESVEESFVASILHLSVDHRYSTEDLRIILSHLNYNT